MAKMKKYGNKVKKKLFRIWRLEIYWIEYYYPKPYTRTGYHLPNLKNP